MTKAKKIGKVIGIIIIVIAILAVLVVLGFNLYQKISYREFEATSQKEFVIPGLSDGFVPQGLTYDSKSSSYLICGYMADGSASRIYKTNGASGKENSSSFVSLYTSDNKADLAHAGGLAIYGDFVYMATGHEINVYKFDDVINAEKNDKITPIGTFDPCTGPAFVHVEGNLLYVGEFYIAEDYETPESHHLKTDSGDYNQAIMSVFKLKEDGKFGLESKDMIPEYVYSITDNAQGMCIIDEKILISTSYGLSTSHVKVYNSPALGGEPDGEFAIESKGVSVPLYYLDSAHLEKDWLLAPMAEELLYKSGKVYVMCESASTKYKFGNLTGDRYCYSFKPVQS